MLQALANKYRPKTFDELIGQDTVSASLKYALNHGRLAHAYLFSGLRGSGKTSSARIFSRALVCEKGPTATPCGECAQCEAALDGKHIDIIEMDAASHRGLEDIQDLIEQTKYAPSMARFKIFIIDEVHMLTPQAANALLKTLEEPPEYVKFILATTDPLKLPATVLSRTQHFRFKQIAQREILQHLENILQKEGVKFEKEALKLISRSGQGSLRDTLTLLDQAIIFSHSEITASKIAQMLGFLDPEQIKSFYALILGRDRERVLEFLKELQDYEASSVIDEMIFYLKESFFAKSNEFSMLMYERFFRILSRAKTMLASCDDNAFVLCVMAFMMIEASNLKPIDEAIEDEARGAQNASATNAANSAPAPSLKAPPPTQSPYDKLCAVIYERDYTLGECFSRNTHFISFENGVFTLGTNIQNESDRAALNKGFKLILQLAQNAFGESVKISVQKGENSALAANVSANSGANSAPNSPTHLSANAEPNSSNSALNSAANSSANSTLAVDESKLQSIQKAPAKDLKSSFESLKRGAKKQDKQAEAKAALDEYFGEPTRE